MDTTSSSTPSSPSAAPATGADKPAAPQGTSPAPAGARPAGPRPAGQRPPYQGRPGGRPGFQGRPGGPRPGGDRNDPRGRGGRGRGPIRRKICRFCAEKVFELDYKAVHILRSFMTARGKILSGRTTGNCAKHQRQLTTSIKRAQTIALLPYTGE